MPGEYERSCFQKLGPFRWAPKTRLLFSQKQIDFEEMLIMYEDHQYKKNPQRWCLQESNGRSNRGPNAKLKFYLKA
jgi:hypothetical protein